jgi:hypothetical protein
MLKRVGRVGRVGGIGGLVHKNLVLRSVDDGSWNPATGTRTLNAGIAPDGSNTASQMVADATAGTHVLKIQGIPVVGNTWYTASIYAQAGTSVHVGLELRIIPSWVGGFQAGMFDLSVPSVAIQPQNGTASIVAVGGGWFRLIVKGQTVPAPAATLEIWGAVNNAANQDSYAGAGESALFWGAQFVKGQSPLAYMPKP